MDHNAVKSPKHYTEGRRLGAIVVPDGMPPEVVAQLVKHILEEDLGK